MTDVGTIMCVEKDEDEDEDEDYSGQNQCAVLLTVGDLL
jgi:hypothetical protein